MVELSGGEIAGIAIAGCWLLYIIISGLLLRFGGKRFAKDSALSQQLRESVLIGHRGSKDEGFPENTILAFKRALDVGVHVIELDVWLTKDKQIGGWTREASGKAGRHFAPFCSQFCFSGPVVAFFLP